VAARSAEREPAHADPAERGRRFERQLGAYRRRVRPAVMSALPRRGPAGLYELAAVYPGRPWKGLRSALCLATCEAFGGRQDEALRTAAAIELFHNAFLVYDDIQDDSELRRGRPTLHGAHGTGVALNVGNATTLLAMQQLLANRRELGSRRAELIARESDRMMQVTLEGQAMELGWIRSNADGLTPRDYLRMCLKKTSWYSFIYPLRVGAIIAQGELPRERLLRFGWYLGAAFQIQDDILNLVGRQDDYGKEIGGDLREGKRTLMLTHLMAHGAPRVRRHLIELLGRPCDRRGPPEIRWILGQMVEAGSIDFARRAARQLAGAALAEGHSALRGVADGDAKRFILQMPLYVVDRQR